MYTITQDQIEEEIRTYLAHHIPRYTIQISNLLRRCIKREYEDDNFAMRKRHDSPFADQNRFQLHADYNKYDFMFDEFDIYDHIEIFGATALPRKDFDNVAIAAAYPLPNRVGENWVRGANGQYTQEGKCDHSKGNWSWAILYYNGELPDMDWQPSSVKNWPYSDTYVTQKLMWDDERSGKKEISNYWRNTQLPYDAGVYAERQRQGIPLTDYQQKVVEAGGWPYDKKEVISVDLSGSGHYHESPRHVHVPSITVIPPGVADIPIFNPVETTVEESITPYNKSEIQTLDEEDTLVKYASLIAHCRMHRDKWTPEENPNHHKRWNAVIEMVSEDELGNAITYGKPFAEKGWKPWQVFIDMCQERIGG